MIIGNKDISKSTYIIAELSANHVGKKDVVMQSIAKAKECGADAIKLQTFTASSMSLNIDSELFMANKNGPWAGRKLYDLYEEAALPYDWYPMIFEKAKEYEIDCFSSPFDIPSVDFVSQFDPPAYKIASFEINDIPLIRHAASKQKPIIMSTGIANYEDIELAVKTVRETGNDQIVVLKCTSSYPAPISKANLLMMNDFADKFGVLVGLSDHTLSNLVPIMSVAMGGCVIEKHFTLDKELGGPDAGFSLNPTEFKSLVDEVRMVEQAKGEINYTISEENKSRRRSLFAIQTIKKGELISLDNVKSLRPGAGLAPKHLNDILGKQALADIELGTPLKLEMFQ